MKATSLPGQVVLVLQGGGALGAYQVGVYQALQEEGVEPDWVIGTSIGAINAAIIAGNQQKDRLARLREFWQHMEYNAQLFPWMNNDLANLLTITQGIPAFFSPNPNILQGLYAEVGVDKASYYLTDALKNTLESLINFDYINSQAMRITVGAVNARTGNMHYFDSREEKISVLKIMASGALPPAFPAVYIDGEPYWDGGIYSNTPIEAILDDRPRKNSVVFSVQVWNPAGPEPKTLIDVLGKHKDIQYSSRASNIERQKQMHRLRHVIRELGKHLSPEAKNKEECQKLLAWGCGTTMQIIKLNTPRLEGENHTKDIDFSSHGIHQRWKFGYDATKKALAKKPWKKPVDPIEGIMIHEIF